jgi:DNA damage-binding protein 1
LVWRSTTACNGIYIAWWAQLQPDTYDLFSSLQTAVRTVVHGVGGLSHVEWRSFHDERKTQEATGFIDGDLVEQFVDLPTRTRRRAAAAARRPEAVGVLRQ